MKVFGKALTILIGLALWMPTFSQTPKTIVVDSKAEGETFEHFWSTCVGAGRANEGLRAGWLEQLELVQQECGFQYVRFHGLFHDDMFPYFENNGKTTYNWQYIDDLFDRMLNLNVKPFVELAFFPKEIAKENSKTQFWWKANISVEPNNFEKWHDLVQAFTEHCVERYGIDEVLTWYFEVWNEPNLNPGFLDGTKSDYFRLYKESALAVKSVDSRLKIGGPSTSNFVADNRYEGEIYDHSKSVFYNQDIINEKEWKSPWMEEFINYCENEKLPLDFITTHPYPTDYALDPESGRSKGAVRYINSTQDDIIYLKRVLAKSKYPNAEIHLTEWSTSPNSRDKMHDHLPPAAFITKVNLDCIGLANSLSYWTFTDIFEEKGGGASIFHGGFGMINFQGIVKPSFHAYRMLNKLGDEKLYYSDPLFVSRSSKTGKITVLAYNYPKEFASRVPSAGDVRNYMSTSAKELKAKVTGLKPKTMFKIEVLDNEHGNIYRYWDKMGNPNAPSREQVKLMKEVAMDLDTKIVKVSDNGVLDLDMKLEPWSVVVIEQIN